MSYIERVENTKFTMVEVIACGDGGVRFVKLLSMLRNLAEQADLGDKAAMKILDEVVFRFERLLDLTK